MSELSPRAQALVRAGRDALKPTAADRERILGALRDRLGDAAVLGEAGTAVVKASKPGLWMTLAGASAGLGVAAGIFYFVSSSEPASNTQQAAPAAVPTVPSAAPSLERAEASLPSAAAPSPEQSATVPRRAPDRLAQEVAILSRAASELRAGRASEALRAVEEHQSKFPHGLLSEERRAARVQALCALGRRTEAESELARLTRIAPQSPHTARARQFCGAGSTQRPSR
ncbi:MAG: hypothetical protein ACOY0T_05675 [Myxococcota bacterium]